MVSLDDFCQCPSEISYQCAADAASSHFVDLNSSILQKSAVHADLTELVLDQNDLLVTISFLNQFLDQCGLARTQKT